MDIDVAKTAAAVVPYVTAVVAAYGKDTVDKIRNMVTDQASDTTVSLGHRLLTRILRRDQTREAIEDALADAASGEEDSEAALRVHIRKALAADPELAREVAGLLARQAAHNDAKGQRSIAIGTNTGVSSTGESAVVIGAQHNHGSGIFIGRDYREGATSLDARKA